MVTLSRHLFCSTIFCQMENFSLFLRSLSFILSLASMAFMLLSLIFLLVDVLQVWDGKPFLYVGMNPILVHLLKINPLVKDYIYVFSFQVYLGHEICHGVIPFGWNPISSSHYELLTMNLWGTYLWLFIAFQLYKRKIFFSV